MGVHLCGTILLLVVVGVILAEEHGARGGSVQSLRRQSRATKPALKITDYHVRCTVVSRYALTTVESTVWNQLHFTKEAAFEVDLPPSAFISNFTITSNGKVYVAEVKERAAARKIYDAAKKQGKAAGLVATKERETEKFRVAVSVPPGTWMSFSLSYEELLTRRLGRYELSLSLRPGQPVQNLSMEVRIAEKTGINFVKALPLRRSRLLTNTNQAEAEAPQSTLVQRKAHCAHVRYSPNLQQQKNFSPKGLEADFVIQYDVELKDLMGDIQVHDGHFVHYFAPRDLPVVAKDVIFVIDVSGSMIGTKIKQTKAAMSTILSDLREGDYFNLITFSDKVQTWKKGRTVQATKQNIRDAKEFVRKIVAEGWTNINAAILSAAQLVNPSSSSPTSHSSSPKRVPMIIFLTDGEATIGVTAQEVILRNAQSSLGSVSLFGLAFGDDADFPLLKRLALENHGTARMVYEDADAALQLKGFYDEVASPLLSDVQLSYLEDQAYDITRALFSNYFQGSELVVTGKIKPGTQDLKVSLTANDSKQKVKIENEFALAKDQGNRTAPSQDCTGVLGGIPSFVHRLWAYFTIKELLLAKLNSTDPIVQHLLAEKATNLSLQFNFVTPVTSLVVVKPDMDEPDPTTTTTTNPTTTTKPVTTPSVTASLTMTATQPANAAPKSASIVAATSKKSSPNSGAKTGKLPLTKPPRPPLLPQGLHTTGRPVNTPLSPGKKAAPPSPKKTTTSPPSSSKTSTTPLFSKPSSITMRTATAPGLSRSTLLPLKSNRTATSSTKSSTTLPTTAKIMSVLSTKTTTAASSGRPSVLPVVKPTSSPDSDNLNTAEVPTLRPGLQMDSVSTSIPGDSDPDINVELDIATLIAATYGPMPGITDAPKLWEASGILDVSRDIQFLTKDINAEKEYEVAYDYDYTIHYDSYSDAEAAAAPDNPTTINSVRVFSSSVDGDPHFVVMLPKSHQNLCFTVDGQANDVLRLLKDPRKGVTVDGHLVLASPKVGMEDRTRTFFDQIIIRIAHGGIRITLTVDSVVVKGEGLQTLTTRQPGSVTLPGLRIVLDGHQSCWIQLGKGVLFLVLIHRYSHPSYFQMEHLGFYISDGQGLSSLTQGLLGQFQHSQMEVVRIAEDLNIQFHHAQTNKNSSLAMGLLKNRGEDIPVTLQEKNLKDTTSQRHMVQCWVVPKVEVERLLGLSYQSYVVGHT